MASTFGDRIDPVDERGRLRSVAFLRDLPIFRPHRKHDSAGQKERSPIFMPGRDDHDDDHDGDLRSEVDGDGSACPCWMFEVERCRAW